MLTALYILFAGGFVALAVLGHVFLFKALFFRPHEQASPVVEHPASVPYDHVAVLS
jgi:hypothetical protein